MVFANDESGAFDKIMVNGDTAHIRLARLYGGLRQVVGRRDLAIRIGGYRKLSRTILRVCRELIESRDAVGRYTNDGRAGGIELVLHLRKCMRFEITAFGIGRRIKIDYHRPFFQSIL